MVPAIDDAGIEVVYSLIGAKVRSARTAADVSQEVLAQRVGLARSSIANLEAGRQRIALHLFILIANALDKDACELLPDRQKPHNPRNLAFIEDKLANSPETMRDFVHGAIARRDTPPSEDPEV